MSSPPKTFTARVILLMLFFVVVVPLLPLLVSRRWDWWEAWTYAILCIVGFVVSRLLAARRHPDLLAERARFLRHENAKPWDKVLVCLLAFAGSLVPLVAGLESLLAHPPAFGISAKIASLVVILSGYALGSYALIENRFFSGMVRIQSDRGHHVVSSGPYRWIRHPGYAGPILAYLATPVFLDSRWALLPTALFTIILVIRTALEDRTLQNELEGYRDYANRVRYRLLPGVW